VTKWQVCDKVGSKYIMTMVCDMTNFLLKKKVCDKVAGLYDSFLSQRDPVTQFFYLENKS
jgi:hypothetical protein